MAICPFLLLLGAREHVHLALPVARYLQREVRRCPVAEEAQSLTRLNAAALQRPVTDDATAQQGRCIGRLQSLRQVHGKVGAHRYEVRVAAISVPAREARRKAQVLAAGRAELAYAASLGQPGDRRPRAGLPPRHAIAGLLHNADHLVPGDDGQRPGRQVALD